MDVSTFLKAKIIMSSTMVTARLTCAAFFAWSFSYSNSAFVYWMPSGSLYTIGSKPRGRPVAASMKSSGYSNVTTSMSGSVRVYEIAFTSPKTI